MTTNLRQHVIAAIRSLMKPIIRLLMRNGLSYKEFALLCKSIFVEAAAEDFGLHGRPTNVSRIAVLTGIDRKEVKRIKDALDNNQTAIDAQQNQDRITRLLSAWHQEPQFVSADGQAKVLPIEGETSFVTLVKRFGGDVPASVFLKELERHQLVERREDDHLVVLQRYFVPAQHDPNALLRAASVIAELSETLYHNLHHADPSRAASRKRRRFERRATNNHIHPKYRKAFYDYLDAEGQAFLERVDAWLSAHEYQAEEPLETLRLSVGLYSFEQSQNRSVTSPENSANNDPPQPGQAP